MATRTSRRSKVQRQIADQRMLFDSTNYVYLLSALLLILGGFAGMYIERSFLGWFSLYIAPLMIVGGFVLVAIGIMRKTDNNTEASETR